MSTYTLEKVLEICSDFTISRDNEGNTVCKHIRGKEVCALPTHFRCELVSHKERTEKKSLPIISHSKLQTLEGCPRQFFLRYIAKAQLPVEPGYFIVGRAFADARAKIDTGMPWALPDKITGEARAKLEVILELYQEGDRPQTTRQEGRIEFEWKGVLISGYFDSISTDETNLYEWKYAQSADTYTKLTLSRQLAVYLKGLPGLKEVTIAVAKKSRHKLGKTETLETFKARVKKEFGSDRSNTFVYKTFPRALINVDRELDYMVELHKTKEQYTASGVYPPNYWKCDDCSFVDFCQSHTHVDRLGTHAEDDTCYHEVICSSIRSVR